MDCLDEDMFIDWSQAPENGYELDADGNAIKSELPEKDEETRRFDRYGSEYGYYLAPIDNVNGSYDFESRSLPFIEDKDSYHVYEEVGNLNDIVGDIKANTSLSESEKDSYLGKMTGEENVMSIKTDTSLTEDEQKEKIENLARENSKIYCGKPSPFFGEKGGAEQVESTKLSIKDLCDIGTLKEVTDEYK